MSLASPERDDSLHTAPRPWCTRHGRLAGTVLAILVVFATAAASACRSEDRSEPPPAAEREPATGPSSKGRLTVAGLELAVTCPPGWRCTPDSQGLLLHERLAASIEIRVPAARSPEELVALERQRRLEQGRVLFAEDSHPLGLVQQTERRLRGGVVSQTWALVRAVGQTPLICAGTAAAVDYPDLVPDFDAICQSLARADEADMSSSSSHTDDTTTTSTDPQPTTPQPDPITQPEPAAPIAPSVPADPELTSLLGPGPRPALPASLTDVHLGMPRSELAARHPDLASGSARLGPFDARPGLWPTDETLAALSLTTDTATVSREALVATLWALWGPPRALPDGVLTWYDDTHPVQATLDAPTFDRLRLVIRTITPLDALVAGAPERFGFEPDDAPLLGLGRDLFASRYPLIDASTADRFALPPLAAGGAILVEIHGEPTINQFTLRLDLSRDPTMADALLTTLETHFGAPTMVTPRGVTHHTAGGRTLKITRGATAVSVTVVRGS